jgi:hypothetical protein
MRTRKSVAISVSMLERLWLEQIACSSGWDALAQSKLAVEAGVLKASAARRTSGTV